MSEQVVVKIQKLSRFVATTQDGQNILEMAWPPDFDEMMNGKDAIYMTAVQNDNGFIDLGKVVEPDQPW